MTPRAHRQWRQILRRAAKPIVMLIVAAQLHGCAAPVTVKAPPGPSPHATLTGGNMFLGFGWMSCGIRELDGKTFAAPFPRKVELTPGRHRVTMWCGGFFVSTGGGDNTTIEFVAEAGHAYQWGMFKGGLFDETTDTAVDFVDVDAVEAHQRLQQLARSWASPGDEILLVSRAHWMPGGDGLLARAYKGTLALTSTELLFGKRGSEQPDLRVPYRDIRASTPTRGFSLVVTLTDGQKQSFELLKEDDIGVDLGARQRAFEILQSHTRGGDHGK